MNRSDAATVSKALKILSVQTRYSSIRLEITSLFSQSTTFIENLRKYPAFDTYIYIFVKVVSQSTNSHFSNLSLNGCHFLDLTELISLRDKSYQTYTYVNLKFVLLRESVFVLLLHLVYFDSVILKVIIARQYLCQSYIF